MTRKMSVSQVRARNITEICTAISERDGISRADIAARAGVSVMTVSNIMEVLLRNKAVFETEQHTENVGRNPALVFFSKTRWMLVLNLATRDFTGTFLNLSLQPLREMQWAYLEEAPYKENLARFLQKLVETAREMELEMRECIGVNVSLPDTYLPESDTTDGQRIPELGQFPIKEMVTLYFPCTVLAATDVKLAAIACNAKLREFTSRTIFYMYFGGVINGALMNDNDMVLGTEGYAGAIGSMLTGGGEPLEHALQRMQRALETLMQEKQLEGDALWDAPEARPLTDELVETMGTALYNICCVTSPYAIVLEGTFSCYGPIFAERVERFIHAHIRPAGRHKPRVVLMNQSPATAITGAGMRLRDKWIKELA